MHTLHSDYEQQLLGIGYSLSPWGQTQQVLHFYCMTISAKLEKKYMRDKTAIYKPPSFFDEIKRSHLHN